MLLFLGEAFYLFNKFYNLTFIISTYYLTTGGGGGGIVLAFGAAVTS
jgi:hypothetical protein